MKRPVAKISNHSRRLATFASDAIDHSRRLAKVANLRFALLRVQSKRTFTLYKVYSVPAIHWHFRAAYSIELKFYQKMQTTILKKLSLLMA